MRTPNKTRKRGVPKNDPRWNELLDFIESHDFSVQDFLACVCANLLRYTSTLYQTRIAIGGRRFDITIQKKGIVS